MEQKDVGSIYSEEREKRHGPEQRHVEQIHIVLLSFKKIMFANCTQNLMLFGVHIYIYMYMELFKKLFNKWPQEEYFLV